MAKDNKWLFLIGGAALVYFLMPKKVKEQVTGGVTQYIPIPQLIPESSGLGLTGQNILDIFSAGASLAKGAGEVGGVVDGGISDLEAWLRKQLEELGLGKGGEGGGNGGGKGGNGKVIITEDTPLDRTALREKAGLEFAGIATTIAGSKVVAPLLLRLLPKLGVTVAPKVGAAATGIGIPLAIAWTAADVIATGYEYISVKNIAGNWLGWREVLSPETVETKTPAKLIPEKTAAINVSKVGVPEAPTKTEKDLEQIYPPRALINPEWAGVTEQKLLFPPRR